MRLSCVGLLRYKLFIKAYVAALYLGDGFRRGRIRRRPETPRAKFFLEPQRLGYREGRRPNSRANVDARTFTALRPRLDRIDACDHDVKPGDRHSLTYVPGAERSWH